MGGTTREVRTLASFLQEFGEAQGLVPGLHPNEFIITADGDQLGVHVRHTANDRPHGTLRWVVQPSGPVAASPGGGEAPVLGGSAGEGGPRPPDLAALELARGVAPHNTFVQSCGRFYATHGRLTPKQIAALLNVRPDVYPEPLPLSPSFQAALDAVEAESEWAEGMFGPDNWGDA